MTDFPHKLTVLVKQSLGPHRHVLPFDHLWGGTSLNCVSCNCLPCISKYP